jgi:hypothetical protein
MSLRFTHRLALVISACMVLQLVLPWHDFHAMAMAEPAMAQDSAAVAATLPPCHPRLPVGDSDAEHGHDESATLVTAVCEWVCAQTQPLPHGDVAMPPPPTPCFISATLLGLIDLGSEPVPTRPPIV